VDWVVSTNLVISDSFILTLVRVGEELLNWHIVTQSFHWLVFRLNTFRLASTVLIVSPLLGVSALFVCLSFILFASFAFLFLLSDIGKHLLLSLIFFALLSILDSLYFVLACGFARCIEALGVFGVLILLRLTLGRSLSEVGGLAL
jgi:hypothetical protein